MNLLQLTLAGLLSALLAAALLASLPAFQATRHGWLSRFSWFLVRYGLPFATLLVVATWFLVGS